MVIELHWFSGRILLKALRSTLRKFNPVHALRNPIIFILYVCLFITILILLFPGQFTGVESQVFGRFEYSLVAAILFLTIFFSFFSESMAEVQLSAQIDRLKLLKTETIAKRVDSDGEIEHVSSNRLHAGDIVTVTRGDVIPGDGQVTEGSIAVDESLMTGESTLVIKESGGAESTVLGGTRVISGTACITVTAEPGATFIDRMLSMEKTAERQKTPNELALTVLLMSMTIVLIPVVVTIPVLSGYYGIKPDAGILISLFVCLMPTTIGGLLPAIIVSGINRVAMVNVVATSSRAVEASGDADVIIFDKTGTLTIGNRMATRFIAAPGEKYGDVVRAAMYASIYDDTTEGTSIVNLGKRFGYQIDTTDLRGSTAILFTPETRVSGLLLHDGIRYLKGSIEAIAGHTSPLPDGLRKDVESISSQGATPLAVAVNDEIIGLIMLKDIVKPGIRERISELRSMGIKTIMCTGDNRLTAEAVAKEAGVDEYVAEAVPEDKLSLIVREQDRGNLVLMSGDGVNDAPALAQANVGMAMNMGAPAAKYAAELIDLDSDPTKMIEVVGIGKQLLMTRGAMTTFSIMNDVAKYFAILPAIFAPSIPEIAALDVLGLSSPKTAIFSAFLFNALIIPLLIPVALGGVKYRSGSTSELLGRNILIYGLGGLISAFIGIKIIDIILTAVGL